MEGERELTGKEGQRRRQPPAKECASQIKWDDVVANRGNKLFQSSKSSGSRDLVSANKAPGFAPPDRLQ